MIRTNGQILRIVNSFLILLLISSFNYSQIRKNQNLTQSNNEKIKVAEDNSGFTISYGKDSGNETSSRIDFNKDVSLIVQFVEQPLIVLTLNQSLQKVSFQNSLTSRIIQFENDLQKIHNSERTSLKKTVNSPTIKEFYHKSFYGVSLSVPAKYMKAIKELNYVKKVFYDTPVEADLNESLSIIHAQDVWQDFGTKGEGIVIAIIDTGIDYLHPDLGGGFGTGYKVFAGYDFVNKDDDPIDDNNHGTHVAGIAAANGENISGVAPLANLVAFKVLNHNGRGFSSDIISAIERTVDVNNDDDFSDKVDVANMSLGSDQGTPDDPKAVAVENAISLGVVFCVSAGNRGNFKTIGSPGSTVSAITVGAADKDNNIGEFSSKGPNNKSFDIKPEIVAPGVLIKSTVTGGAYKSFTGTSMSTPHVTGVSALLKSIHPDWNPYQIKSAIVNSATDLGEEIMVQGAGLVNALSAANLNTTSVPSTINFGLDEFTSTSWNQKKTITITNHSSETQNYNVVFNNPNSHSGISIESQPSTFTLTAGETQGVTINLNVNNFFVPDKENGTSLSYTGFLQINGTQDSLNIPWAFSKINRVTIQFEDPLSIVFLNQPNNLDNFYRFDAGHPDVIDPFEVELLGISLGTYDLFASTGLSGSIAPSIILERNIEINESRVIEIKKSDAHNLIVFKGVDENGNLLSTRRSEGGDYKTRHGIIAQYQTLVSSDYTLLFNSDSLYVSDINENEFKIYSAEYYNSLNENEDAIYIIKHNPVTNLSNNSFTELSTSQSELYSKDLFLQLPPTAKKPNINFIVDFSYRGRIGLYSQHLPLSKNEWEGKIFLNDKTDDTAEFLLFLTGVIDTADFDFYNYPFINTPNFQIYENTVGGFIDKKPSPDIYFEDDRLMFGGGPLTPAEDFNLSNLADEINITVLFQGPLREIRSSDVFSTKFYVYDNSNKLLASGDVTGPESKAGTRSIRVSVTPGKHRAEFVNTNYFVKNIQGEVKVITNFDTSLEDKDSPLVTSLKLLNTDGKHVYNFEPNNVGNILFSARDYEKEKELPKSIIEDSTKIFAKEHGTNNWINLEITNLLRNYESSLLSGYDPIGSYYSADLTPIKLLNNSLIDLKIEVYDQSLNSSECLISPAFAIGEVTVGTDEEQNINLLPAKYELYNNYPNPFNPNTFIKYDLPENTYVSITIYNLLGQQLIKLVDQFQSAGSKKVLWDGKNSSGKHVGSGIYIYRMETSKFSGSKKMILLK